MVPNRDKASLLWISKLGNRDNKVRTNWGHDFPIVDSKTGNGDSEGSRFPAIGSKMGILGTSLLQIGVVDAERSPLVYSSNKRALIKCIIVHRVPNLMCCYWYIAGVPSALFGERRWSGKKPLSWDAKPLFRVIPREASFYILISVVAALRCWLSSAVKFQGSAEKGGWLHSGKGCAFGRVLFCCYKLFLSLGGLFEPKGVGLIQGTIFCSFLPTCQDRKSVV